MSPVSLSLDLDSAIIEQIEAGEMWPHVYPEIRFSDCCSHGNKEIILGYETTVYSFFFDSLSSLYRLVRGEPAQLQSLNWIEIKDKGTTTRTDDGRPLVRSTNDSMTVGVALPGNHENSDFDEKSWPASSFVQSVTVSAEDYVRAYVSGAENYASLLDEYGPPDWRSDVDRWIGLLADGHKILRHVETEDTTVGFTMERNSQRVQSYLYQADYAEPEFSEFLIATDVIKSELDHLRAKSDEKAVKEAYGSLLSHESVEIRRAVAQALAQNPDVRAKKWLLGRRWKDDPEVMPAAIRAASELGGTDVAEVLCEILGYSNHEHTRETAAEALADFEDKEVINALESVAESDDSEAVREAARQSLETIQK